MQTLSSFYSIIPLSLNIRVVHVAEVAFTLVEPALHVLSSDKTAPGIRLTYRYPCCQSSLNSSRKLGLILPPKSSRNSRSSNHAGVGFQSISDIAARNTSTSRPYTSTLISNRQFWKYAPTIF